MRYLLKLYESILNENKGNCYNCGDTATGKCLDCGKPICEFCTKNFNMRTICGKCYNKRNHGRIKNGEFGADVIPMNNGIMNIKRNI